MSTLLIGRGHTVNSGRGTGNFYMGTGTLDATTITLANSHVQSATGTMRVTGGTVIVSTLNMGLQSSTGLPTSNFTLQSNGVLEATTINVAAQGTHTFTWNAGTIRNKAGGNLTINAGITTFNLATSGAHVFEIDSGRTGSVATNMSGGGRLTKAGAGLLTLSGSNSYSGGTTISAGTLRVGNSGTAGTLGGGAVTNDANLEFLRTDATTVSNVISGTGSVTLGSGTLTLSAANSFQGGATISPGTLVAANSAALGTGTATVASGARLRLDPGSIIANPIANLGTGSFLGTLDFAGGGLARASTAGGTTLGTLLAGSAGFSEQLNPAISWLAQTGDTASDIMQLNNTSGTAQVLSLSYDPLLTPDLAQDAFLGWYDTGTTTWVNAIDSNVGGTGSFFQGSWRDYLTANPTATPTSALGVYGHDTATNSVWAVVNHNSDFAVIVVPEPSTFALAGLGLAGLAALLRRRLNG